jgi:hypothetical protein
METPLSEEEKEALFELDLDEILTIEGIEPEGDH